MLELLAQGSTNKQIGVSLNIGDNTIRCHVNNILEKLQVSDRTEAVAYALKKGLTYRHGLDQSLWKSLAALQLETETGNERS